MLKPTYDELLAALAAVVDDYDDSGCEGVGTIDAVVHSTARDYVSRARRQLTWPEQGHELLLASYDAGCNRIDPRGVFSLHQLYKRAQERKDGFLVFVTTLLDTSECSDRLVAVSKVDKVICDLQAIRESLVNAK